MTNFFDKTELSSTEVSDLVKEYSRDGYFVVQEPIKFLNNIMGYTVILYRGDAENPEKIHEWAMDI